LIYNNNIWFIIFSLDCQTFLGLNQIIINQSEIRFSICQTIFFRSNDKLIFSSFLLCSIDVIGGSQRRWFKIYRTILKFSVKVIQANFLCLFDDIGILTFLLNFFQNCKSFVIAKQVLQLSWQSGNYLIVVLTRILIKWQLLKEYHASFKINFEKLWVS